MKKTKLENLMQYYELHRQVGHTTFMLRGLTYPDVGIIIVSNKMQAINLFDDIVKKTKSKNVNRSYLTIGELRIKTIDWLSDTDNLMGINAPIIVDHFAMQMLVLDYKRKLLNRVTEIIEWGAE